MNSTDSLEVAELLQQRQKLGLRMASMELTVLARISLRLMSLLKLLIQLRNLTATKPSQWQLESALCGTGMISCIWRR